MRRTRDLVGLPVLNIKTGDQIGWIQDVVFNYKNDEITGILLEGGHFFHSSKGIPIKALVAVGKDALTVNSDSLEELEGVKWSQKVGNQVYTQSGDAKGTIEDVFLDDSVGRIVGFEVSDGLFADLVHGRGAILEHNVKVDGKDVLIVDDKVSPWDQGKEGGSLL